MGKTTLHITNGDSTTQYIRKLGFKGAFITWREMLCEGPSEVRVGSEGFWKSRYQFLKDRYQISKKQFIDYTLKEYRFLCAQKKQEEIVLWFEHDLFCQINLCAVLSWLKNHRKGNHISLVCSGDIKGSSQRKSLTELTENQLRFEYQNRQVLHQDSIAYGDYIWQLYCAVSPLPLENAYKLRPNDQLKYLPDAIKAHLQRFPSLSNGLNIIENNLLTTAVSMEFDNKNSYISWLIKTGQSYGFGDIQYKKKCEQLAPFFASWSPVRLSETGKKVQQKLVNVYASVRNDATYFGGAKKYNYLYDQQVEKLLKITSL